MKALIIAAGMGKRLNTKYKPKPLIKLLGLPLILRTILSAKEAGIRQFMVVVGYKAEMIREELGDGSKYGVEIDYIENKQWEKGNGVSALMAKGLFKERFFLLMSDHIFEPEILKELKNAKVDGEKSLVVVDRKPEGYIDLEDATKVLVEKGKVRDIGKGLAEYDGTDCGIFYCSSSVFDALHESIEDGDDTLSGGMRKLAKGEKLGAYDIGKKSCIDIDTKDKLKTAEDILCKKLKKPSDGPISRGLNRPLSIRISKQLVKTGITPNVISFLSFITCIFASFLLTLGSYLTNILAGVLIQFSSIIDGCDGEVARLKFQMSDWGAWFDAVLDRYADALIIFGMTYGWWKINGGSLIWIISYFTLMGSLMNSYTAIKYDSIFLKEEKKHLWRFGRDVRMFMMFVGVITNQVYYLLITLAIITNFISVRRLCLLKKS